MDDMSEHREEIIHPNEEKSVISAPMDRTYSYLMPERPVGQKSWVNSRFVSWFIEFDEVTLRPFLIRKYNIDNIVAADALDDIMKR